MPKWGMRSVASRQLASVTPNASSIISERSQPGVRATAVPPWAAGGGVRGRVVGVGGGEVGSRGAGSEGVGGGGGVGRGGGGVGGGVVWVVVAGWGKALRISGMLTWATRVYEGVDAAMNGTK